MHPRRILAPHPWPFRPETIKADSEEPLFYLSWPGWELFLSRRLNIKTQSGDASPLLLSDEIDPETDFKAIDQLVSMASEMGAGLLNLASGSPESLPSLLSSIRNYHGASDYISGPALDDRSYLALWAYTEYQSRESERMLAQALNSEKKMWAALRGDDKEAEAPPFIEDETIANEPDRRTAYAWKVWKRLSEGLMNPSDVIVPTSPAV